MKLQKGFHHFILIRQQFKQVDLCLIGLKLIEKGQDFAFETTPATKCYRNFVIKAKEKAYHTTLLFFWLRSSDLAVKRVETRVKDGRHNIPEDVIRIRYVNGLRNFFELYETVVDEWMFIDNSGEPYEIIAQKAAMG